METIKNDLFEALSNTSENVYIYASNMKTGISKWSENAIYYFDLPETYYIDTLTVWLEKIFPDDREGYLDDINAVFRGEKSHHAAQYRAKNRYGDYVWLECTGNVVRDKNGDLTLFAGMITRLDNQAKYDSLTKQLSIHQFYLYDEMDEKSVVLMLGMDHFRKAMLTYGYASANEILVTLSNIINENTTRKRCYRMVGDEFLIILPGQDEKSATEFFQKIKTRFSMKMQQEQFDTAISFSGAGAVFEPGECDKETLVKRLEHSMEAAKEKERGSLVYFSKEIEEQHRRLSVLAVELDRAIENNYNGFELYFQPIKTTETGEINTVEALLRFHCDTLGNVSPTEFIPVLESSRKINKVGLWVMEQTIKQNKIWNDKYEHISTGFNVSYRQMHDNFLLQKLFELIEKYQVNPKLMVVELTESCKVIDPEGLSKMFQIMLDHGIRVALDDFGMEYSSITLLRDLPVTTVKIDHSFVRTLKGDKTRKDNANFAIIAGICDMCKRLGLNVVVEGIENKEVDGVIKELGVKYTQGYFYSKPVPAKEVEKFFR